MPAFQSSWGAGLGKLTTHAAQLRANNKKPTDGVIATFTNLKPGFAYAVLPLPDSPKQIREANHLLLQNGHCYLRLFAVRYRRQIAQCLGAYPTFSRIEQQLHKNKAFRCHDQFVRAYISTPFVAHIAKSKKENPFYLGTLHRLNEGLPIRVAASASASASAPAPPAIPGPEVDMIDMALVPCVTKTGHWEKKQAHQYVIKNHHTEHQIRLIEAADQDIVRAKEAGMQRQTTYILECHFNRLVWQFNEVYLAFWEGQEDGIKHLEMNLLSLTQKANKFSADVYQAIINQAKKAEIKNEAVTMCAQRQQANLEALAIVVGTEQQEQLTITDALNNWGSEKNKQVLELQEKITELRDETQKGFNWTEEQRELTLKQTIEECQKAIVEVISKQLPNDQGKRII